MAELRSPTFASASYGDRGKRGRFDSPELQRAAIDAWCHARGIEVVDEIRDLGSGGGHPTRPGLEQAMGLVPTLADGIVVGVAIPLRGGRWMDSACLTD